MTAIEFEEFPKIARLFRGCTITEKLDGSNAQVLVPDDPTAPLLAGSRNRWLTTDKTGDNFGFAAWVAEHADELRTLGPGRHFGEWWGAGIQRRYGLTEKRFSLFNVARWTDGDTTPLTPPADPRATVKPRELVPSCCSVVPVLYAGPFMEEAVDRAMVRLLNYGSSAAPGFMDPEGVVVWHEAARQLFKVTIGGDGHKEAKPRKGAA